jgi:predicted nucleotidyltransferase
MTAEDILQLLRSLQPEVTARYKARALGLFGSVVRGEHVEDSDVDILVDFEDGADLLDLSGLALFLEERLQRKVDLVPRRALRPELRDAVFREVVLA